MVQLDKSIAPDQKSSVKRVLSDFKFLFYLFIVEVVLGVGGVLILILGILPTSQNFRRATWIGQLQLVSFRLAQINWVVMLLYFIVEYMSMAIIAPIHYERAFTKSGVVLYKKLAKTRDEMPESKDQTDNDEQPQRELSRRTIRASTSIRSIVQEDGRALEDYRQNYIQARETVRDHVRVYAIPAGTIIVSEVLQMLSLFTAMFERPIGSGQAVWDGVNSLGQLVILVFLLSPVLRANVRFDEFSNYIMENTDFSFEFAARYSAYIQRHPPVYLTICGVAINKLLMLTLLTSTATTFLVFAAKSAPALASDFVHCPLTEACLGE